MKKKIVAIVAIIALIAVLGVVLCACNADSYAKKLEKAGYTVIKFAEDEIDEEFGDDTKVEWAVSGVKGLLNADFGYVIKFADKEDAKEAAAEAEKDGMSVKRSGKIVIAGSEDFVKAAK